MWPTIIMVPLVLLSLIFIIYFLGWIQSKRKKGRLVLDCGEHPQKASFVSMARMFAFASFVIVVSLLWKILTGKHNWQDDLYYFWFLSSFSAMWLVMVYGRLQILENGIWQYCALIKWNRIESYEWQGEENRKLKLKTNPKLPFWWGKGAFPVPMEHQEAVDELLQKYISTPQNSDEQDQLNIG